MPFFRFLLIPLFLLIASAGNAQQRGQVEPAASVNMRELAARPRQSAPVPRVSPRPRPRRARPFSAAPREAAPTPVSASTGAVVSSFAAEFDNGTATPPDTGGAVG